MIELIFLLVITIISAFLTVYSKNIVYAVVFLLCMNVSIGILYYMMGAPLVSLFQLAVFAGAIVVFFIIAIMFTNAGNFTPSNGGYDNDK